ncbi:MAG: hypothetical protein KF822_09500 [Steroidobacteraceae bacterium]|nr:hypothetical protein [Steroidobacteraceae bacterium]
MTLDEMMNTRLYAYGQQPQQASGVPFQIGQTIQGQGNWDTDPIVQALMGYQGQNLGQWVTEDGRRYIDTPWGRTYDSLYDYQQRGQGMVGNESGMPGGIQLATTGGVVNLGRYGNEHGSDSLYGVIGEDGTLQRVGTDRESNRDMNTMLALIAGAGVGSALYGGAAGGAGLGGTGSMSAGELAAMDAAGGSMAGTGLPYAGTAAGAGTAAAGTAAGGSTLSSLLGRAGSTAADYLTSPAGVNTVAQLLGGAYGAHEARAAAESQLQATREAIAEQRRQYDQSREDLMPWMTAGRGALDQLTGRLPELTERFTGADLANDPGYQFELEQGLGAVRGGARGNGTLDSGATLKALMQYGQGLASTRFNDAFNRDQASKTSIYNMLAGISGTGQTTANQVATLGAGNAGAIGSLLTQGGNAQAAGRIGAANSWINAMGNAWNGYQQQSVLDALRRGGASNLWGT